MVDRRWVLTFDRYRVLVASANGGLIETVPDAISLHSIKKTAYMKNRDAPNFVFSLRDHFIKVGSLTCDF